ncbi:hypothetical protein EG328_001167 [Venturia inaequalis]|uniref:Uncharacterized protein n=1 Tax=Venturia inaequalis TaxID=5025 RepID=A0A8H3UYB5_VENIN|nr:hypothetical protein EG327_007865 [Venturia inaequalis]KAE9978959.1 hypothetical protein EG328_001167 [Venturia inaequalis]
MENTSLLTIVVLSILLYLLGKAIYLLYFHPLACFPGPWYHAVSELPINYHCYIKGDIIPYFSWLHAKYGHTVRTAPNILSCIHADVWPQVYGPQKGEHKENGKAKTMFPVRPNDYHLNIFTSNFDDHTRMRRVLAPAFSDKGLRLQEPVVQGIVDDLIIRLKGSCEKDEATDLVKLFHFTLFDLTGLLFFGKTFGCLAHGEYHPWVGIIFESFRTAVIVSLIRSKPLGRYLLTFLPQWILDKEAEHRRYSEDAVKARMELGVTDTKDIVTLVLQEADGENTLSSDELIETSTLETTATSLSGLFYLLAQNQSVCKRLAEEIRQACPTEKDVTIKSTQDMSYLRACLKEVLRIYQSVVLNVPRIAKPGGLTIDGIHIPEGTFIAGNHSIAYMSPANFRDPDSFLPERWLPEGKEHFESDNKAVHQPFNIGPRACIGKNLGLAEMRLIAARMLWNFDFELEDPEKDSQGLGGDGGWLKRQRTFFLREKGPLMVKLRGVVR